ncbi:MAG: sigma-54 dependent transcriptional regulator [candidate division Zixibacteria bacterium]|nr:sigma-54 dependent transcriptional regulator [candidate division Zixibacteria bacterium]MBU1469255.1 sigma-54 dependent transcriptional regulator [candidate division Zixibacteria bacterium]MBU2626746.1 sigma-54 dependent transcriptional regulator [candidate division Zixibacteria bacterium]
MAVRVLLADDDDALRRVIQFKLRRKGFDVTAVADGQVALDELGKSRYDVLLTDMKMPKLNGIELLERAKKVQPELEVILITAFADVSQAVKAVKLGAFDYLTKPFDDDELFVAIEKALKFRNLEDENKQLREELRGRDEFKHIVGVSRSYKELMRTVEKIAPYDATVLLTGESGTGKEVIARQIHHLSPRLTKKYVAVNCAAIPRDLIESELFGHVKGAFTGAIRDKRGKFELADGGTIMLDEIGELETELQVKLLRVLQERVIEPVGSERKINIDVRVIAATNVDLKKSIDNGRFREDLYYRLNVIPLHVPSLRERREDIPLLIREFLRKHSPDKPVGIEDDLVEALSNYSWPGNIRELENLIGRMVILRGEDTLTIRDLPDDFDMSKPGGASERTSLQPERLTYHEATRKIIVDALNNCGWNRTKAAKYLKMPRHVLIYRMKKYDITSDSATIE